MLWQHGYPIKCEGLSWSYGSWIYSYLCNLSVPITTYVVSSIPTHGEVYSIQYYVIKFVSDLRQVTGFLHVLRFPPPRYNWNLVNTKLLWNMTWCNLLIKDCLIHLIDHLGKCNGWCACLMCLIPNQTLLS
jgi:hypothetical protein